MSDHFEYRVRWKREGRGQRIAILQSEHGARVKADRLKQIDGELSGDIDWSPDPYVPSDKHPLEGLPPLLGEPIIERRPVGVWSPLS